MWLYEQGKREKGRVKLKKEKGKNGKNYCEEP